MNATTTDGHSRGGSATKKFKKNSLPAVPLIGLEAAILRISDDFHGSDMNQIVCSSYFRRRLSSCITSDRSMSAARNATRR
jgi:hypothetical protein